MPKSTLPAAAPLNYIANPAGSLKRRILRHWQLYVIMLFPLANLIIFKYIPMIGLQIAFKTYRVRAGAIIYLAALTGISHELTEAATIDGCTRLQRIWHVDLPGIRPSVITLLVLNMGYVMSVGFEKVFLMQSPSILNVSEVMSTYIYRIGLLKSDFSYSTAIGLVNSIINLILILTVNQIARKTREQALWQVVSQEGKYQDHQGKTPDPGSRFFGIIYKLCLTPEVAHVEENPSLLPG